MSAAAPLVARVAGLPGETVERFSTALGAEALALDAARDALHAALAALADRLHARVPAAEPAERRVLLAVRRDCHNHRPLRRHRAAPGWEAVRAAAGELAERAGALEEAAAEAERALAAACAEERARQRGHLRAALEDAHFRRALALASPDLALHGLGGARGEANLLRYLSRAATKLSPFSALTAVGLAAAEERAEGGVRFAEGAWRTRSLVRVRPYLLDRCAALLLRHPPVRAGLEVVRNSSAVEVEPGRFCFLRPAGWALEGDRFAYHAESLVRVGLGGPLVAALRVLPAEPGLPFQALVRHAASAAGVDRARAGAEVEALLGVGFLVIPTPWRTQEGHEEAEMLAWLRALPAETGTEEVREALERLVALEEALGGATEPAAGVRAIDAAVEALWAAAARLGGIDPAAGRERVGRHSVYEDVLLSAPPASPGGWPAVLRLPRRAAERALDAARPLARLAALFDHRRDWLLALDAFAGTRWAGRGDVPLVEVFHAAQPLWRDHLRFRLASRAGEGWREGWNPCGLAEVEALAAARHRAADALPRLGVREGGEQRMDPAALDRVLDALPAAWTRVPGGAALYLQPLDGAGERWMLNRIKEGTGRFGSRFTPGMDPALRERYTAHLAERGRVEEDGEAAELLDLRCVQGDTLNVHARQTPRVLALPGAEREAAPAARVALADLWVRFGAGMPHLRGARGERLVPVQLGFAFDDYLPPLVKFLARFGPSEMGAVFPPQWTEEGAGGMRRGRRTWLGPLVLHRAAWSFPAAPLRDALAGGGDAEVLVAVERWRREHGVPSRVFVQERVRHPQRGFRTQPQYLDLTSPLFLDLFRAALVAAGEGTLTLVEALPDPAELPVDGAGRRRAVEVIVDSLALAPAPPPSEARGGPRRRGRRAVALAP